MACCVSCGLGTDVLGEKAVVGEPPEGENEAVIVSTWPVLTSQAIWRGTRAGERRKKGENDVAPGAASGRSFYQSCECHVPRFCQVTSVRANMAVQDHNEEFLTRKFGKDVNFFRSRVHEELTSYSPGLPVLARHRDPRITMTLRQ